jgi:hypothetical protein
MTLCLDYTPKPLEKAEKFASKLEIDKGDRDVQDAEHVQDKRHRGHGASVGPGWAAGETVESTEFLFDHGQHQWDEGQQPKWAGVNGDNPAWSVRKPEMQRKERHALNFAQASVLVDAISTPAKEMVLLSIVTSVTSINAPPSSHKVVIVLR